MHLVVVPCIFFIFLSFLTFSHINISSRFGFLIVAKKCHSKNKKEKVAKKERPESCSHKDCYIRLGLKKPPRPRGPVKRGAACSCYLASFYLLEFSNVFYTSFTN